MAPHMMRQGASAISSGAMPAMTSQGQPNQSAAPPSATAAATRTRRSLAHEFVFVPPVEQQDLDAGDVLILRTFQRLDWCDRNGRDYPADFPVTVAWTPSSTFGFWGSLVANLTFRATEPSTGISDGW